MVKPNATPGLLEPVEIRIPDFLSEFLSQPGQGLVAFAAATGVSAHLMS